MLAALLEFMQNKNKRVHFIIAVSVACIMYVQFSTLTPAHADVQYGIGGGITRTLNRWSLSETQPSLSARWSNAFTLEAAMKMQLWDDWDQGSLVVNARYPVATHGSLSLEGVAQLGVGYHRAVAYSQSNDGTSWSTQRDIFSYISAAVGLGLGLNYRLRSNLGVSLTVTRQLGGFTAYKFSSGNRAPHFSGEFSGPRELSLDAAAMLTAYF